MITILCAGSRGDFQPYIALAQELQKQNKSVRITAGQAHEDFIKSYGIDVYPLTIDLKSANVDPKLLENAGSSDNPLKMLRTFNQMKQYGQELTKEYYNACVGSELIIYHPGCTIGYFAAKQLNIPCILASPFPLHKTKEYLSVVMYGKSKPSKLNLALSYKLIQGMLWMASKTSVSTFFKQTFKTLPANFNAPFERQNTKASPSIISCSEQIFTKPQDVSEHIHYTGYWFVEDEQFTPSKELLSFLENGSKPVYIGFGSMTSINKEPGLLETIIEAVNSSKKRAIISGFGEVKNLPPHIIAVDSIPHSYLFKHVSAVCHHGGAGTSAAGFRAGVPSIIIPFSNDQFAWAHRAYDLGIGVKPIYKKHLTSDALSRALIESDNEALIQQAQAVGLQISQETGVQTAVDVILSTLTAK